MSQENNMAIEHACMRVVRKPWGSTDLRPWSEIRHDGGAIGELWFQRPDMNAPDPTLLLKLLFTKEPLSIQGSRGRCLRAIDRFGAWQDRGLVHPFRNARRLIIVVVGAILFWVIDKFCPDAQLAQLLKLLVVLVCLGAIVARLLPLLGYPSFL
jgi:hypothetical protein